MLPEPGSSNGEPVIVRSELFQAALGDIHLPFITHWVQHSMQPLKDVVCKWNSCSEQPGRDRLLFEGKERQG